MPNNPPISTTTNTMPMTFNCPMPLAKALLAQASLQGVPIEEFISDLVTQPLIDQLGAMHS